MRKKHVIACWLLVVYLVTAVGPVWASLSCRCLSHRAAAEAVATCCAHHHHYHHHAHGPAAEPHICGQDEAQGHASDWSAPCCCDRHSTKIALYTNDDDRTDRLSGPVPALVATGEVSSAAPEAAAVPRCCTPASGRICHGSVRCAGAHAPPVRG